MLKPWGSTLQPHNRPNHPRDFNKERSVNQCAKPANFDHQAATLQGTARAAKKTTSRQGNNYTLFKLQDPVSIPPPT
jgi:hypothetical protein